MARKYLESNFPNNELKWTDYPSNKDFYYTIFSDWGMTSLYIYIKKDKLNNIIPSVNLEMGESLSEGNVEKLKKHYGPMFDEKLEEDKDYLVVPGDLDVLK